MQQRLRCMFASAVVMGLLTMWITFPTDMPTKTKTWMDSMFAVKLSPAMSLSTHFSERELDACSACAGNRGAGVAAETCALCLEGGHAGWPVWTHPAKKANRLFWLTNVLYDRGQVWFHHQRDAFRQCYAQCGVTWFSFQGDPFADSREGHPTQSCMDVGEANRTALVISNYATKNLYHFIMDNLFITYMTVAQVAQVLGCTHRRIEVHTVTPDALVGEDLAVIWTTFFGEPLRHTSEMHGCYSTVVYGLLYQQRQIHWPDWQNGWLRDPALSTWLTAYSFELRRSWGSLELLAPTSFPILLLVHHWRMPDYMWTFPWNQTLWDSNANSSMLPAHVVHVGLAGLPVVDQIRLVASAHGLLSVEGAAFSHQVFLPPESVLLIINIPVPQFNRPCSKLPETWHETAALHLGHTAVDWRFCGGESSFAVALPMMLELLFRLSDEARAQLESLVCVVLHTPIWASATPRCHKRFNLPLVGSQSVCSGVGRVGIPFDDRPEWEYVSMKGVYRHDGKRGVWTM